LQSLESNILHFDLLHWQFKEIVWDGQFSNAELWLKHVD
jgi:hypothetical protein